MNTYKITFECFNDITGVMTSREYEYVDEGTEFNAVAKLCLRIAEPKLRLNILSVTKV